MAPTIYTVPGSAPVRAVLMTLKAIGLDFHEKVLDLSKGGTKTPEFLKLNPQGSVPTLVDDDGFVIWDSHAIIVYLVTKYAKDDSLYPKDMKKRAVVDQRLYFDSGVAFPRCAKMIVPIVYKGKKTIDDEDKNSVEEVYSFLEAFLSGGTSWVAGEAVTVADFCLIAIITTLDAVVKINSIKYPRVVAWVKRAEGLSVNEVNQKGLSEFRKLIQELLG